MKWKITVKHLWREGYGNPDLLIYADGECPCCGYDYMPSLPSKCIENPANKSDFEGDSENYVWNIDPREYYAEVKKASENSKKEWNFCPKCGQELD